MTPRTKSQLLDLLKGCAGQRSSDRIKDVANIDLSVWYSIALKMERLFEIPVLDAPGAFLVGAVFQPSAFEAASGPLTASASGKGSTIKDALISCLAEAVETISTHLYGDEDIVQSPHHPVVCGLSDPQRLGLMQNAGRTEIAKSSNPGWRHGLRLHDSADIWVPAELCYRNLAPSSNSVGFRLGLGSASGPTYGYATLHGMLELIERDAVALWWQGGAKAREIALDQQSPSQLTEYIRHARGGASNRQVQFFDLTSDLAIPCVVAITSVPDAHRTALGFAARLTPLAAMTAAFSEVLQMEMAIRIVEMKTAQQGAQFLSHEENMAMKRATELDVQELQTNETLQVEQMPSVGFANADYGDAIDPYLTKSQEIAKHSYKHGIEFVAVDVTRPVLEVPSVRVISPELQPFPSHIISKRLAKILEQNPDRPNRRDIDLF